jgi:acetylornithine deacetylase/succinyl-diaminopimelate desuccinylase-like protein
MRRGQYLSELVIILAVAIGAIVGMQSYLRRSMQAKLKNTVEAGVRLAQKGAADMDWFNVTPATVDASMPIQYEPYYTNETLDMGLKQATREKSAPQLDANNQPVAGKYGIVTQESFSYSNITSSGETGFNTTGDKDWL